MGLSKIFPVLTIFCLATFLIAVNHLLMVLQILTTRDVRMVLTTSLMVCAIIIPFYFYIKFLFKKRDKTVVLYIVAGCFVFSAFIAYADYAVKSPFDLFAIDTLLTISIFTFITSFILTFPVLFMKSGANR